MYAYIPLFAWWVVTCLVGSLVWWLQQKGVPMMIYNIDATHVTQGIAALFFLSNLWIGFLAWKWARFDRYDGFSAWDQWRFLKHMKGIWHHTNQLFLLGLIGTVIGSMYLFYSQFGTLANIASADFKTLVSNLLPPLGIVFSTTALGVSGAFVLSEQLWLFAWLTDIEDEG